MTTLNLLYVLSSIAVSVLSVIITSFMCGLFSWVCRYKILAHINKALRERAAIRPSAKHCYAVFLLLLCNSFPYFYFKNNILLPYLFLLTYFFVALQRVYSFLFILYLLRLGCIYYVMQFYHNTVNLFILL